MTKILYWNIENFTVNKIFQEPPRKRRRQVGSSLRPDIAAAQRQTYITRHIDELDPDIFIVVEVETPYNNNRGTLCTGGGKTGLLHYLTQLRLTEPAWALVPPLITGNKESVGVFYRSDILNFVGPDYWTGGIGAAAAGGAVAYAGDWLNAMPGGNTRAARVQFPAVGVAVPPVNVDFGVGTRHPYQTSFQEIVGGRTIHIYSVHAPANFVDATTFLANMATMDAIAAAPVVNELRLVLGDFNLNLLRVADNTYTDCYAPLKNLANAYTVALEPPGGALPAPILGYRGYFATHMRPRNNARCWSKVGSVVYYPTYNYSGDRNGIANDSIDNVLYQGTLATNPPELTVVNGLVGSPYANAGANPGGCPEGFADFTKEVDWDWHGQNAQWVPPDYEAPDVAPQYNLAKGILGNFTGWDFYGKIRSTSDHLPLLFDC